MKPRILRHPGPKSSTPDQFARADYSKVQIELPAKAFLNVAAERLFGDGFDGGLAFLRNVSFEPFRFVIPDNSADGAHAAWYSKTYAPHGEVVLEEGIAIIGRRDGAPFLHCHGRWRTRNGEVNMGHILPLESVMARDARVEAIGLKGAVFDVAHDAETNFPLFRPRETLAGETRNMAKSAFAVKISPNEDISQTLEAFCARKNIFRARVHGLGSLNEARFTDGRAVSSHATEFYIRSGKVELDGAGVHKAALDVAGVAIGGELFEGTLTRGDNPICITAELIVVPL